MWWQLQIKFITRKARSGIFSALCPRVTGHTHTHTRARTHNRSLPRIKTTRISRFFSRIKTPHAFPPTSAPHTRPRAPRSRARYTPAVRPRRLDSGPKSPSPFYCLPARTLCQFTRQEAAIFLMTSLVTWRQALPVIRKRSSLASCTEEHARLCNREPADTTKHPECV